MSQTKYFPATNSVKQNAARAVFGKNADDQKRWIFQIVALWPKSMKEFGGRYADAKGRVHPIIEGLLDILVPALCERNETPFKMFAESTALLDHPVAYHALSEACEQTGYTPPLNKWGMESLTEIVHRSTANPFSTASVDYYPAAFKVPMKEADFLRKVKARFLPRIQEIETGYFHRLCSQLNITFQGNPTKKAYKGSRTLQKRN